MNVLDIMWAPVLRQTLCFTLALASLALRSPKMDLGGDKYWLCKGDWKAAQRAQRAERKAARRAAPGNPTDVSDSFSNADSVSGSEDESGDK
jgi:hypothetical protein